MVFGMKNSIRIHPYSLTPLGKLNSQSGSAPRLGALLQIKFAEIGIGYADCFPWPEFGDLSLSEQMNSLRTGSSTPILERSFEFALKDAQGRATGVSLFEGLSIPPSHLLITHLNTLNRATLEPSIESGFRIFKIKVGQDPKSEASIIRRFGSELGSAKIKFRLDFNSSMNKETIQRFLEDLGQEVSRIDFLEDPTPFDPETWSSLSQSWKVHLALDHFNQKKTAEILSQIPGTGVTSLVVKPASQNPTPFITAAKNHAVNFVFTTSMDQPLGQLCAAWCAATTAKLEKLIIEPVGLLSQVVYQGHPWSHLIQNHGPKLIPPSEPGFGLGRQLETLRWESL